MRVISGCAKGHKLKAPQNDDTRPTSDRVKESLFNIIYGKVEGAHVLDLFAGTGNLGIEALSRGARSAVFVDKSRASQMLINENLQHTKLYELGRLMRQDVFSALEILGEEKRQFDIIFLDPPYSKDLIEPVLRKITEKGLLKKDGLIVAEKRKSDVVDFHASFLHNFRNEGYGDTELCFYRYENSTTNEQ